MRRFTLLFLVTIATSVAPMAFADGTETLGAPSLEIASGTHIVAAGTGLQNGPGTIDLEVPAGSIQQVIAYWSGAELGDVMGDDSVTLDGAEVFGELVGGPAFFFNCPAGCGATAGDFFYSAFRADITDLGLVSTGSNSIVVDGLDFFAERSGVGLLVIVDDGSAPRMMQIRDGLDLAFAGFRAPRDTTVPQTFQFGASDEDRTAELFIFAGSVGGDDRTSAIEITVGGNTTVFSNELISSDGGLWDTFTANVGVPAGSTAMTVQILSTEERRGSPASISWIGTGFSMPAAGEQPGAIGDFVWCDDNDDGVYQSEEVGIGGVQISLTCAGDDGVLGTADDVFAATETEADGSYLFEGVPAGLCEVSVDEFGVPDKELGQCDPTVVVDLGAGESYLDADFCFRDPPLLVEGCSPGYWKNHHDSWDAAGYDPDEDLTGIFMEVELYAPLSSRSLDDGLRFGGGPGALGGAKILLRAAVAALLNAAHPDVSAGDVDDIVAAVDDALGSGSRAEMLDLAGELDDANNAGCPLN